MENKGKFSSKVIYYSQYRPSYPSAFINYLVNTVGMMPGYIVADIGAGTGILVKLIADKVKKIYAIEPDSSMRACCESSCAGIKNCHVTDGYAESTSLPVSSVDMITAAQSYHWFDRVNAKKEFQRILKPGGILVIVYNRKTKEEPVSIEHCELLGKHCPDYRGYAGGLDYVTETFSDIFSGGICEQRIFENDMKLTLESFIGGTLSTSYAPSADDVSYGALIEGLTLIFTGFLRTG